LERRVIVIVGPTCSGKTSLGIKLSKFLNSEVISADSRQIYKFLNIGTAKPSKREMQGIKHHLIDILKPDEEYNASKFEKDALELIKSITEKNKIPVVVGGSGLYIKALVDGIFNTVDTDEVYRKELLKIKREIGVEKLYTMLEKIDPVTASKLLPQNWKRVIRALEVFKITGKPIWEFQKNYKRKEEYNFLQFGLNWPRHKLYAMIENRVDNMIKLGLIDEVKNILAIKYTKDLNSLNTVGYKEIISYLDNEIEFNEAVRLIKRNTRRYAKRQLTWFRKDTRITWFNLENVDRLNDIAKEILQIIDKVS